MKDNSLLSIESLVNHINENYDFHYESEQLRKATNDFYDKLIDITKDENISCDILNEHNGLIAMAEQDYFKAGFSAGVRLLLESLGADI